ncbi:hypothetical protein GQ607_000526 [Colletotrichum asianum]|uniref:Uncharacterized protein n=1 Tax=Colletotrichum asianum TaxID=702518 RepID=A0A8H3WSX1_9PEZI|nr:hypothetical protein GQ607_000526 [Colletotrichum asianum]
MRQPTFVGKTLVVAYGATMPILRNVATRSYVCRCRLAHYTNESGNHVSSCCSPHHPSHAQEANIENATQP